VQLIRQLEASGNELGHEPIPPFVGVETVHGGPWHFTGLKFPVLQKAGPLGKNPWLQLMLQLLPERTTELQVPRLPLAGAAVIVHGFGWQVPGTRSPR
jgi:hypothetical protein